MVEAHDRHLRVGHDAVEVAGHPVVVLGQQSRRGDAPAGQRGPVQEEADEAALIGQVADIAGDPDAVHAAQPQLDVVGQ